MRSEQACSLARFLMNQAGNALQTHAVQWMERSLDDSANRRLSLGQSFLAADAIVDIMHNVASGMVVYPNVIKARINAELPFMATENIIMEMVSGGDRQEVHEQIRLHSLAAAAKVKEQGLQNDLIDRIRTDDFFTPIHPVSGYVTRPQYVYWIGRSANRAVSVRRSPTNSQSIPDGTAQCWTLKV